MCAKVVPAERLESLWEENVHLEVYLWNLQLFIDELCRFFLLLGEHLGRGLDPED